MMTPQIPACPRCGGDAVSQEGHYRAAVGHEDEHPPTGVMVQIWCTRCYKLATGRDLATALENFAVVD